MFINTSDDFLVGCDCTDGCQDKSVGQLGLGTCRPVGGGIVKDALVSPSQVEMLLSPADPPGYRLYPGGAD